MQKNFCYFIHWLLACVFFQGCLHIARKLHSIPFTGPLPGPLQPGNLIRISGTVASSASCFSVNLQNGTNDGHRSDIALHLSPVFAPPPRLVRNSLENQNWGPEESHGSYFPFSCGQGFEILILVEVDHFKIAIDGQHFTEFHYRLPLHSISHISVDGDVSINFIKFEGVSKSPMDSRPSEGLSKPLGFVIDSNNQQNLVSPTASGRSPSPYDSSALPYPSTFGPSPTTPYAPQTTGNLYPPPSAANPYGPSPNYNPYGPPPQGDMYLPGRVSPNPYGPPPSGGPSPYQYPQPQQGYPSHQQGYPQQAGGYPPQGYPSSNPYPSQPGPYPGTSVVYPGQEKKGDSGMNLGPIAAAGAAALAGMAGSALIGGKHGKHKKNKHGHGMGSMLGGAGPGGLIGGVGSLLGGNKHGHSGSSGIPVGGAVAGGAAALAGAYMLSKSPMGKILKPKKRKKHKWGGYSSSSSSSSSDEE